MFDLKILSMQVAKNFSALYTGTLRLYFKGIEISPSYQHQLPYFHLIKYPVQNRQHTIALNITPSDTPTYG